MVNKIIKEISADLFAIFFLAISFPFALIMWIGVRIFGKPRYKRKQNLKEKYG